MGNWGIILNEFLSVEHNGDGSLKKSGTIDTAATQAASAIKTINGKSADNGVIVLTASDVNGLTQTQADSLYPRTINGVVPNASGDVVVTTIGAVKVTGTPTSGQTLQWDGTNWNPVSISTTLTAAEPLHAIVYPGSLIAATNVLRPGLIPSRAGTLNAAQIDVSTAPTGASLVVTVKQGSTTLATLTVPAGSSTSSWQTGINAAVVAYSPITFDITSIGSVNPGADLAFTGLLGS